MHIASEVSSTTSQPPSNGSGMTNNNSSNHNNNNNISKNNKKETTNSGLLTAETLAERTLDGLLADHPGELVRTGSPHIVSIYFNYFLIILQLKVYLLFIYHIWYMKRVII